MINEVEDFNNFTDFSKYTNEEIARELLSLEFQPPRDIMPLVIEAANRIDHHTVLIASRRGKHSDDKPN